MLNKHEMMTVMHGRRDGNGERGLVVVCGKTRDGRRRKIESIESKEGETGGMGRQSDEK